MNIPTLYLDSLILAAAAYPAGFGHSIFTAVHGRIHRLTTTFLGFLILPYLGVGLTVLLIRPGLLNVSRFSAIWLAVAVFVAPLALFLEYGLRACAVWTRGRRPGRLQLPEFWRQPLSNADHVLLGLIAVGEEIFYRQLWYGVLHGSFGFATQTALALGSVGYGLNHLAFGWVAVCSKTLSGLINGALYVLSGESIWPPIVAHTVQNFLLFRLAGERHE